MALRIRSVNVEEARSRIFSLFRSSYRSIHNVQNLDGVVVSDSFLCRSIATEMRKNPYSTTSKFAMVLKSDSGAVHKAVSSQRRKDVLQASGVSALFRHQCTRGYITRHQPSLLLTKNHGASTVSRCFARSFASGASKQPKQASSETKKEVSTVEDPFDDITYNIPQKPVTFAEGASYSIIILAGLGVAAAAAYAVFKELIFEPKEYKIFNKALKRIQDDSQVRVRIGSPITGYGQESRNRAARQRIPNKIFTDEFGIEHVEVNFYIRGPHGAGKVYTEMFRDKEDKQWKFTYLIVEIISPSKAQLMLESYIPSAAPATA